MADEAKPDPRDEVLTRPWKPGERPPLADLLEREWLVTNGLGGYASGTISGAATRRYHGLLIAAHPAPLGRVMMVNHLWEFLRLPDYRTIPFGGEEKVAGQLHIHNNQVKSGLVELLQCLLAIAGHNHFMALPFQEFYRQLLIDDVVFC